MSWYEALILGVVQGLTEFFPVSSSGHLVMMQELMGLSVTGIGFEVAVHVATLLSVVVVYRVRIVSLCLGLIGLGAGSSPAATVARTPARPSDRPLGAPDSVLTAPAIEPYASPAGPGAWGYVAMLAVATIPAAALGLAASDWFEARFDDASFAGIMLLVTGVVVWSTRWARATGRGAIAESLPVLFAALVALLAGGLVPFLVVLAIIATFMAIGRATAGRDWTAAPPWGGALLMGLAQAVAILPGISRSGSTVVTGLWRRIDPEAAAEFSFLMSIPAILGAAVLKLPDLAGDGAQAGGSAILIGGIAAAVSGVLAIRFFVSLLRRRNFHAFAIYCWVAGTLFLVTR